MLRVHAFFHLNLMFSSIEEESRPGVIKRCYWPILHLAESLGKTIGIEATGYTLQEIARHDPSWIVNARRLMDRGLIELVGSGYAQIIGPLFPASLTEWNLKLGHETYQRLLGRRPRIALINEQAYSAGLVPLYSRAGYEAILMDWDMCAHAHGDWPDEWRYHVQLAQGPGTELPVIWTNTVLFQKLQRLAHGDIGLDDYLSYVLSRENGCERTLALYSSDAEVFDFRPGRYKTETEATGGSEWDIVGEAFARLATNPRATWISPSEAMSPRASPHALNALHLESPAFPVPVKKQMKYNVSRWAVTGRADFEINRRCRALVKRLKDAGCRDGDLWRRLCWLASSDFRTHITEKRFVAMLETLEAFDADTEALAARANYAPCVVAHSKPIIEQSERAIRIETDELGLVLNPRKGLAIEALRFKAQERALIGTIPHGTYDDLVHAFDWFSGTLIAEFVGQPKITDLVKSEIEISETPESRNVVLTTCQATPIGRVTKTLEVSAAQPRLSVRYVLNWPQAERGTLRLGNITLLPDAVDPHTLYFETHNGGEAPERFALFGQTVDHGEPVSFLVSASSGAGMSEGSIVIGDANAAIRISAHEDSNAFLGFVTHRVIKGKVFCRVSISAAELDETRKPWGSGARELRLGYTLTPV